MIELPEAMTIARQINETLTGKRIARGDRGNSPHKFAFYTREPDEYAKVLAGKAIGPASAAGSHIDVSLEPDHVLRLGDGGERILFHSSADTLPDKRQLYLRFDDDTYLTVTVQGWGAAQLFHRSELAGRPQWGSVGVSPLSEAFTLARFEALFDDPEQRETRSVKAFIATSKPGVTGVGNGYLQDILFRARIHPRRRAIELDESERRALHAAIVETLRQAVALDGRDTERDLFGERGRYVRLMDSRTRGKPCPDCGTPIEKIQFMGGACYLCPSCQT